MSETGTKSGKKKLGEMTDHELLMELVKQQKSDTMHQRILAYVGCGILAILLVVSIILVPKATLLLNRANRVMAEAEETLMQVNTLAVEAGDQLTQLDALTRQAGDTLTGVDEVVDNLGTLVEENTQYINEAVQDLNDVDFDGLNDSITALKSIVEPVAALFRR